MRGLGTKSRALINTVLAVLIGALYITISAPRAKSAISELYNSPVYRGHAKGLIALECAVSWDAQVLPDMLDLLHKRGLRITFLVSGDWAQDNEALLERMVQDGHEIGTMGMTPLKDGDVEFVTEDVKSSVELIRQLSGVKPTLYYSGSRDEKNSSKAAGRLELTHVLCSVDLLSGRGTAQDILFRALDEPFYGSILLIQPTREAYNALPALIDGLSGEGLSLCTVGEAISQ